MEVAFKVKMDIALHERIRQRAFNQKRSMADVVREAVEAYLGKEASDE